MDKKRAGEQSAKRNRKHTGSLMDWYKAQRERMRNWSDTRKGVYRGRYRGESNKQKVGESRKKKEDQEDKDIKKQGSGRSARAKKTSRQNSSVH